MSVCGVFLVAIIKGKRFTLLPLAAIEIDFMSPEKPSSFTFELIP
jgi:hypothetical protein